MKLLLDTSAILALVLKDDQKHPAAVEYARRSTRARFILTELILSEVVTRVRARADAPRAKSVARSLLDSRRYEVILVDAEILERAVDHLSRFADKRLSFTDCASFATMDRLDLDSAFTFDHDFRDCGYRMVP